MTKGRKRKPSEQTEGDNKLKSQKTNGGKNHIKEGTVCSICTKKIYEKSKNHDGDEAIFCEGRCGWLHHQCAGLSDLFFKAFTDNNALFPCFCMLKSQSEEISNLRSTVEKLKGTLKGLTKQNSKMRQLKLTKVKRSLS